MKNLLNKAILFFFFLILFVVSPTTETLAACNPSLCSTTFTVTAQWCCYFVGSPTCDCSDETYHVCCRTTCFRKVCNSDPTYICEDYVNHADTCYSNGTPCSCCVRDCEDCTPAACPSGYTKDINETNCRAPNTIKKTCDNTGEDCGDDCGTTTRTCYLLETNDNPSMPASVRMIVDNVTYTLSTNSSTPTTIKYPSTASNVQVSVPTTTFPSTSDGGGYAFKGFNDGVNNEWAAITTCTVSSCSGVAGEDFFIQSTANTQTFDPTTKTILQVLKKKADGKIGGMYYTKNKCDSTKLYSSAREGYYKVDSTPVVEDWDFELDVEETTMGCSSSTYSGLEINNPLKFSATITDEDGLDEINALILWFSKDTTVPTFTTITTNATQANTNDFGVMIRKNAGAWNNPRIYFTNTANEWVIMDSNKLAVTNLNILTTSSVNISFGLEFKDATNDPIGLYNVYGTALDTYMINSDVIDQSRIQDLFDWGIDLTRPSIDDVTQKIVDVSNFLLTWNASESESSLKEVVLNGYRTGGQINSRIELFAPTTYEDSKGYIEAIPIPPESEIGRMGDHDASWEFVDIATYNDLFTAGWFNNNWLYRKPITISNVAFIAKTNEDVLITLDTKDLIDNGRLQTDCGDLRFLDNNDTTQLSYWIENGCNTTSTDIWVRIPSLPSAGKTIYMYYSNPGSTNGTRIWNGEVTMLADAACPSGWTRNTDFDSRFPYGSNTYGTPVGTIGKSEHNHSFYVTLVSGSSSGGTGRNVVPRISVISRISHSHTVSITTIGTDAIPPYRTMVFCKKTGLELTSGLISMFSSASLPSGWSRFSALDNKYPYGGTVYGATGGATTHTHTLGGNVSNANAPLNATAGTGRTTVPGIHSHTISGTASQASNLPPTWQMVFAKNNGSISSENIVLMVNSLPPVGWRTYANLTNRFPSGYTSSQDGGGSSTHSHTFSATLGTDTTVQISSTTGTTNLGGVHTHSVSGSFIQADNVQPYLTTIFAERKTSENINIGTELRKGETWPLVGVTDLKNVTSMINIGENEGGLINMYVTAYDQACNSSSDFDNIDLNPWMTTKGGTVYSTSGITNASKDVAGLPALEGVFQKLTSEELDAGTELISARNDILPELIHPELKAVRALNIYDSNDRKSYWFDHFKEKLATEKASNATQIATPTSPCATNICYVYEEDDIVLSSGFECNKKILVMSEGDITINPDITSSSTSTGCIFLAKGNIYIGAGTYKTGANTNVRYDYIDAYLMAQGQIIFNLVDINRSLRDGIEINGGLVAFGNEVTTGSAINVLRNLKLLNISNPTVVVNYDYKYPNMATKFFGVEAPIYKQEIGFKSF